MAVDNISESHLQPREKTPPRYPEESNECVSCGSWEGGLDDPYTQCVGFDGEDCEFMLCGHCGDRNGRCDACLTLAYLANKAYLRGDRFEPWLDPETVCENCDYTAKDGPGTYCAECGDAYCPSCVFTGSDGKPRCECCAKEKVGL